MGSRRAFRDVTNSKSNANNVVLGNKKNAGGGGVMPFKKATSDLYVNPAKVARTQSNVNENSRSFKRSDGNVNDNVMRVDLGVQQTFMPQPAVQENFPPSALESDYSYQFTGQTDDIDAHVADNPLYVTDYVDDMYNHFRQQEVEKQVLSNYMERQQYINSKMRAILVDWLVEVHLRFKLVPETLYLCVSLIDRYLSKREVSRTKLQLVGVTCMFIASKYEEIYPPELRDLVYICDNAYTKEEIIDMEEILLRTLKYRVTIPSAHTFLIRFLKAAHADKSMVQLTYYILDSTLQCNGLLDFLPSQLAAASIFVARRCIGRNTWSPTLLKYSGYYAEDIAPIAREVIREISSQKELKAVDNKYSSKRYGAVSKYEFTIDF